MAPNSSWARADKVSDFHPGGVAAPSRPTRAKRQHLKGRQTCQRKGATLHLRRSGDLEHAQLLQAFRA
eukprot:806864-Alexandrium_andersonii.AAC.1